MPIFLSAERFPFQYRGRKLQVTGIQAFAMLQAETTPPGSLSIYLTNATPPPAGGTPPVPPASPGSEVELKTDALYGTGTLSGAFTPASPVAVPQVWWLSITAADLSGVLESVEDFFVLFQYRVA